MVIQSDFAWQEQTADLQPGNATAPPETCRKPLLAFEAEEAYLFKNARRMTFGPFLLQMVRSECPNADATIV
jgi:hypothetical protein